MISEKRGAFWNPKNLCFHRNRGSFKDKVSDFFSMENTDGLHKFPMSGGNGLHTCLVKAWLHKPTSDPTWRDTDIKPRFSQRRPHQQKPEEQRPAEPKVLPLLGGGGGVVRG